jgi:signal transduction histidine kinase
VKGTGIGLSVVREHAQMHGGKVEIMDSNRGAHVRITLPISARTQSATPVLSGLTAAQAAE